MNVSKYIVVVFMFIAFILRVGAVRTQNVAHPDEIFQTQEPAHRLAYGYGIISWEWREGVRSWVFPSVLAMLMRATEWMGSGSSGYVWAISVLLSLVSLTTVWFAFASAERISGVESAIIAAGACAMWHDLIYFGPRTLTEVVAAHILLPGLWLGKYENRLDVRKRMFLAGLFCGFAVSLRMQLAPAIGFAIVSFCYREWRNKVYSLALGFALPVIGFGLVDAASWSYPFQSFIRYFAINVIEGRSLFYGTQPWYWYMTILTKHMWPVLILAIFGVRRCPFLGWVIAIILASHSFLSHKEIRFIYPAVPLLIVLSAVGIVETGKELKDSLRLTIPSSTLVGAALVLFAFYSFVFGAKFEYEQRVSGGLHAFDQLSTDHTVCGVGLYQVPWFSTGGYAHLHQNVPIVLVGTESNLSEVAPTFNALLTDNASDTSTHGFQLSRCWDRICLYRRSGPCLPPPRQEEVNTVLLQTGQ
jgi:GPI mannosyltransferase 3